MTEKQYPELPDFDAVEQHVYSTCRRYISQDMLEPIYILMRNYADATCALRIKEVAQATEDKLKEWQADGTLFERITGALEQQEREIMRLEKELRTEAKLSKPARVGGGTFRSGVSERLVIEAAQRQFEIDGERKAMTPEQHADQERNRRELWDMIHGPLEPATTQATTTYGREFRMGGRCEKHLCPKPCERCYAECAFQVAAHTVQRPSKVVLSVIRFALGRADRDCRARGFSSAGIDSAKAWVSAAITQPQEAAPREPLTADDLREPKNGKEWRVEWWNESARIMLPPNKKLDGFMVYKNGTLIFTIKEQT